MPEGEEMTAWKKRPKFGNVKTELDGYTFASKFEASVYAIYKLRERAGELKIVKTQSKIILPGRPHTVYIADFELQDKDGETFFGEAKGYSPPAWGLKLKLYRVFGPAPLESGKGSHIKPVLTEIVIPKPEKTCPHCSRPI